MPPDSVARAPRGGSRIFLLQDRADQLLIYQGTKANPTFICALDNSGGHTQTQCPGSSGGWHQSSCSGDLYETYYSALPPGLTDGINALAWTHRWYWSYRGPAAGGPGALRLQIAQVSQWTSSDSVRQPFHGHFVVTDDLPPAPPLSPAPPAPPPSPSPPPLPPPLPPLSAGDCMVVGAIARNPDRFSIVLLAPLRESETITVTDAGERPLLGPRMCGERACPPSMLRC